MNLRAEVRAIAELVGARQACTKPWFSPLRWANSMEWPEPDPSTRDTRVNQKLEVIVGYLGSLKPAWAT